MMRFLILIATAIPLSRDRLAEMVRTVHSDAVILIEQERDTRTIDEITLALLAEACRPLNIDFLPDLIDEIVLPITWPELRKRKAGSNPVGKVFKPN